MRRIFAYIFATMALAACNSSEELFVEDVQEQKQDIDSTRMYARIENPVVWTRPGSRSLYYDKTAPTVFSFCWTGNEVFGVYPYGPNEDQTHINCLRFVFDNGDADPAKPSSQTGLTRDIKPGEGVQPLVSNTTYVATIPYSPNDSYTAFPVRYEGQRQEKNVDISVYNGVTSTSSTNYQTYLDSEKAATQHLEQYDYLITKPTTTRNQAGVEFDMKRVGSISRFFMKCPANIIFDELQLYNGSLNFIQEATIRPSEGDAVYVFNQGNQTTSHVMSLKLGMENQGMDFTLNNNSEPTVVTNFHKNTSNVYVPYLIAYMMMAPTDFSQVSETSTLYLLGHETGGTKRYFKAEFSESQKPNISPNVLYRWSLTPGVDEPITFTETHVEEWEQTAGLENNGAGTGSW